MKLRLIHCSVYVNNYNRGVIYLFITDGSWLWSISNQYNDTFVFQNVLGMDKSHLFRILHLAAETADRSPDGGSTLITE